VVYNGLVTCVLTGCLLVVFVWFGVFVPAFARLCCFIYVCFVGGCFDVYGFVIGSFTCVFVLLLFCLLYDVL